METWIAENVAPGSWVIVDESMLFWTGAEWHQRGVSAELIGWLPDMLGMGPLVFVCPHVWDNPARSLVFSPRMTDGGDTVKGACFSQLYSHSPKMVHLDFSPP